jgi:predicted AAA+ superfamily ATPase
LSGEEAEERLRRIAIDYLYRDAFSPLVTYDQTILNNLLRLLAYQIGNEVNYSELGRRLGITGETIQRYIDLLEKAFIIFRLNQYRKNRRAEVGRLRKVYFYDLGIRNALIDNFQPIDTREDAGALWENFCIMERRKYISKTLRHIQSFYWRNDNQREIDYIEEERSLIRSYEFKLGNKNPKLPIDFSRSYPDASYVIVRPKNFTDTLFSSENPAQIKLLP